MIGRREFITLLSGAAATWPLAARAQQAERVRRIGVLLASVESGNSNAPAFIQALANLGWSDGRNVRMDLRWAGGDANRMGALAQELVGLQPDIILTSGAAATAAVQRETRTIPIVFAASDPVVTRIVPRLIRWIASIRRRAARVRLRKHLIGRSIVSASRPTSRVTTRTTSHSNVLSVGW